MNSTLETATLAGGCFWCLEPVFDQLNGVVSVDSGYANGHVPNPGYRDVCTGATGHAEVIRVVFDPAVISYRDLLNVFFAMHDPTTLNQQGADRGTQYRSAIFYHSDAQKETAETLIQELNAQGIWGSPVVTQVEAVQKFYPAEDFHQEYFEKNPEQPYCQAVVAPKVAKLRKYFLDKVKQ